MKRFGIGTLGLVASLALAACGGSSGQKCGAGTVKQGDSCVPEGAAIVCGAGTTLVDGACVPDSSHGTCGAGSVMVDGQCVPDSTHGTCGEGATLVGGVCVPNPVHAGFLVTVEPAGCDAIVDGLAPARVTVTAIDGAGQTVTGFAGALTLAGLGSIAVTPSTLTGFANGVATADVLVTGQVEGARIVVFDAAHPTLGGTSAPFNVVAHQLTMIPDAPTESYRVNSEVPITVDVTSNACLPVDLLGATLQVTTTSLDATVVEAQAVLTGEPPYEITVKVTHNGETTMAVPLVLQGLGGSADVSINIAPAIRFGGLASALGMPASARLSWEAATAGEPGFTYSIYAADTAGAEDFSAAPLATTSETSYVVEGLANNVTTYFVVRAEDSLADGFDQNRVELGVTPGDILFVDDDDPGVTRTGEANAPLATIQEAVSTATSSPGDYVAIWVAAGTYTLPDAGIVVPAGLQLVGSFTPGDTAAAWLAGTPRSSSVSASATPTGPGIFLRADTALEGFTFAGPANYSAVIMETGADRARIYDLAITANNGIGVESNGSLNVTVANTAVTFVGDGSIPCVVALTGSMALRGADLEDCGSRGLQAVDSLVTLTNGVISGAATECVYATGGELRIYGGSISTCGTDGVKTNDAGYLRLDAANVAGVGNRCVNVGSHDGNLVVTSNSLASCPNAGVYASTTGGIEGVVSSNTIAGAPSPSGTGIWWYSDLADDIDLTMDHNQLSAFADGIHADVNIPNAFYGGSVSITHNQITDGINPIWFNARASGDNGGQFALTISDNEAQAADVGISARLNGNYVPFSGLIANNIVQPAAADSTIHDGIAVMAASDSSNAKLRVIGNTIAGAGGRGVYAGLDADSNSVSLEISNNEVTNSATGISVYAYEDEGMSSIKVIDNRVSMVGAGISVDGTGYWGETSLEVAKNTVRGAADCISLEMFGYDGNFLGSATIKAHDNKVSACYGNGLSANVNSAYEAGIEVVHNDILGVATSDRGYGGIEAMAYGRESPAETRADVTVTGNNLTNAAGIAAGVIFVMDANVTVENNGLLANPDQGAGIYALAVTMDSEVRVTQNTIAGGNEGVFVEIPFGGSGTVQNNIVDIAAESSNDFARIDGSGTIEYNMFGLDYEPGPEDTNFAGKATFLSVPPDTELSYIYNPDPDNEPSTTDSTFTVMDGSLYAVGDLVILDAETTPRTVTGVEIIEGESDVITVDGLPITYAMGAISVLHWPADSIAAPVDLRLAPSSAGIDAGSPDSPEDRDGTRADVGASGGPNARLAP